MFSMFFIYLITGWSPPYDGSHKRQLLTGPERYFFFSFFLLALLTLNNWDMYTEQKRREWRSDHHRHYQHPERLRHGGLENRDTAHMHSNYWIDVFSCTSIECNKSWSNLLLKMYSLILKMYRKCILCASAEYKCMGHILNLVCCLLLNFIHRRHKKVSNAGEHMYMGITIYGHRRQKKVRTPGIDIYWILRHERSTTLVSICIGEDSGYSLRWNFNHKIHKNV